MVFYEVHIELDSGDSAPVLEAMAEMGKWDHLAGHWSPGGLTVSANSSYYESEEHLASSLNSLFEQAGVKASAKPGRWYNS